MAYQYDPFIWFVLASAIFIAMLGIYGWRRRSVAGALPFAILMLFLTLVTIGGALELAAADAPTKLFWAQFVAAWYLPVATAALCFALDYADLGHWLTRRNLAMLAVPPLASLGLTLTNDTHHLVWRGFSIEGYVHFTLSPGGWALVGYAYLVALVGMTALLRLFVRSPRQRWPVALCLIGQILARAAYLLESADVNLLAPVTPVVLATPVVVTLYAIALFRFQLFDLIPVARETVIEQMHEGMLVLDAQQQIIDLNPAAEKILDLPAARARQRTLAQVLPAYPHLTVWLADPQAGQSEISLGTGHAAQAYTLHRSALKDQRGLPLGYLILFQNVTGQKQAQAQLVEQQRAQAQFEERARLARELHDGQAQVLAYVKMRAQVARDLLAQGQMPEVDAYLANLISVVQEAHSDIREYLLGVRSESPELTFLSALQKYIEQFSQNYGLRTELQVAPDVRLGDLPPTVQAQLLRIIQESLTNVRKHAHASWVQVNLSVQDNQIHITIQDDGQGFAPEEQASATQTFGLRFMRERVAEIHGSLQVQSTPGQGTRVIIQLPLYK